MSETQSLTREYLEEFLATLDDWKERPIVAEPEEALKTTAASYIFTEYVRQQVDEVLQAADLTQERLLSITRSFSSIDVDAQTIAGLMTIGRMPQGLIHLLEGVGGGIITIFDHALFENKVEGIFIDLLVLQDGKQDEIIEECRHDATMHEPMTRDDVVVSAENYLAAVRDLAEQRARGGVIRVELTEAEVDICKQRFKMGLANVYPGLSQQNMKRREILEEAKRENGIVIPGCELDGPARP